MFKIFPVSQEVKILTLKGVDVSTGRVFLSTKEQMLLGVKIGFFQRVFGGDRGRWYGASFDGGSIILRTEETTLGFVLGEGKLIQLPPMTVSGQYGHSGCLTVAEGGEWVPFQRTVTSEVMTFQEAEKKLSAYQAESAPRIPSWVDISDGHHLLQGGGAISSERKEQYLKDCFAVFKKKKPGWGIQPMEDPYGQS